MTSERREHELVAATIRALAGELRTDSDLYRSTPAQDPTHARVLRAKADALDTTHARLMDRLDRLTAGILDSGPTLDTSS